MRRFLLPICVALGVLAPVSGVAQDDDEGRIVRFLEDQLSSGGARQVDIQGFRGALSSTAELDRMEISDAEGTWLILEGAELTWSRSALLRGNLVVDEIAATRLTVERAPIAEDTGVELPEVQAEPFSLPELPVSINLGRAAIEEVVIGESFLGFPLRLSVNGSAALASGDGNASLALERIDGPRGAFDLDVSYSNETQTLDLALILAEAAGGIAAEVINLPGRPSIDLSVTGTGPLNAFAAEFALATEGIDRLAGGLVTRRSDADDAQLLELDISGDVSPLIEPEYGRFFGDDVALEADVTQPDAGGLRVDGLSLRAAAVALQGMVELDAQNRPLNFDITGRIADRDAASILLPVPGATVEIASADLVIRYDATAGDTYDARILVSELTTEGVRLGAIDLDAGGTITGLDTGLAVSSDLRLGLDGITLDDPALAEAVGPNLNLTADIAWAEGQPVTITDLDAVAGDLTLQGDTELSFADTQFNVLFDVAAEAADLTRFAAIAGQPLQGAIEANVAGSAEVLSGAFDIELRSRARDVFFLEGLPPEFTAGTTDLTIAAARDLSGLTLSQFELQGQQVSLSANARITPEGGALPVLLNVTGRVADQGQGPVRLPIPGQTVDIGSANLIVRYDAAAGDAYDAQISVRNLVTDIAQFDRFDLDAGGTIRGLDSDLDVQSDVRLSLGGIALEDAALARAVGSALDLTAAVGWTDGARLTVSNVDATAGDVALQGDTELLLSETAREVGFDVAAQVGALSRFAPLAGQPLRGQIDADLSGTAELMSGAFDVVLDSSASDLFFIDALPAALTAGATDLAVIAARDAHGDITLTQLDLDGQQITLSASGGMAAEGGSFTADASLANLGLLVDAIPGPARASLRADSADNGGWRTTADLIGPNGITARVAGLVGLPDGSVDLTANGGFPLTLVNPIIQPRSVTGTAEFGFVVRGQPSVEAVNGSLTASDIRVSLPTLQTGLERGRATVNIAGGLVELATSARLTAGGAINAEGQVDLRDSALPVRIDIDGRRLRAVDPTLYNARVDDIDMRVRGALTGDLSVTGDIELGETEVRVPETGLGVSSIPDITHIGENEAERATREAAGLLRETSSEGGSQRVNLDVGLSAPGRVFIRGRGLDAELGGALRLGGTTANMIPSGQFDLIRGRFNILGARLDLTEGAAFLQGSAVPFVRLVGETQTSEYTIFIRVDGPASEPVISFSSEPSLPEDEVLAQLLFGRSVENLSPLQILQLVDAVASLIGEDADGGIVAGLRNTLGLDDLDLETDEEGNAALRAGRYLSDNIYADVVVGNEETDLSLNIDLTPSVTGRGSYSTQGRSTLGLFFERDY